MAVQLKAFLDAHPLGVEVRLLSWRADGPHTLRCVLEAYPWWRGGGDRAAEEERLEITFHGVRDSSVGLTWAAVYVEDLAVATDDPRLWRYGTWGTLFGGARLPDPRRFFVELWDLFHHQLRAGDALQFPIVAPFRAWAERVTTHDSYHLMDGPARVVEAVCPLLDTQGVAYRVVRGPERPTDHLQVVWIGDAWVVCTGAEVEHLP